MTYRNDSEFHSARAAAERAAADNASCEKTRALHRELAELHTDRSWLPPKEDAAAGVDAWAGG